MVVPPSPPLLPSRHFASGKRGGHGGPPLHVILTAWNSSGERRKVAYRHVGAALRGRPSFHQGISLPARGAATEGRPYMLFVPHGIVLANAGKWLTGM